MAGRPPKPAAIKRAEGNPGRRPIPVEPDVSDKKPRCPSYLRGEAKKEWRRVVDDLHQAGIIMEVDRTVLALYCNALAQYLEAEAHVLVEGAVELTPNGYPVKSAWLTIRDKAFDQMMKCLTEMGMTPVSRAKVAAREQEKFDPFEQWVKQKLVDSGSGK